MGRVVYLETSRRRHRRAGRGAAWRQARRRTPWWRHFGVQAAGISLALFSAIVLWPAGSSTGVGAALPGTGASDRESARFAICGQGTRTDCVIDGDTFWYGGEKIRIADINTPEVSSPECAYEAQLGAAATARLQALLNAGAFSLASVDRDRDSYGRLLRTVTRNGQSLGDVLVDEGLAEEWQGYRGSWC